MPTVLRKHGFRVYFYSHEPNEPPHVRVDRAGASADIRLSDATVASKCLSVAMTRLVVWRQFATVG